MRGLAVAGLLAWALDRFARRLLASWWSRRMVAELAADLAMAAPRGPQT